MALLILCGDQTGGVARSIFFILFIEIFRHLFDQVPAWQFTAKFKDSQDVIISFDKV